MAHYVLNSRNEYGGYCYSTYQNLGAAVAAGRKSAGKWSIMFVDEDNDGVVSIDTETEPVECYRFTCSPDEYDPQRIVRECVEDGRLWFMVDNARECVCPHVLFIRKDFLTTHTGKVDSEELHEHWGDGDIGEPKVPGGYRCVVFDNSERDKILEQLKAVMKTKQTYTVYYHGGK